MGGCIHKRYKRTRIFGGDDSPLLSKNLAPEREAAQRLMNWLTSNSQNLEPCITEDRINDLCTLAYSDNIEHNKAAACSFIELSQKMTQLAPESMIKPIIKLLQSTEYEVQKPASLALTNIATRGPSENKISIIQAGAIPPLLRLLQSTYDDIKCNASGCITTLATIDSTKREIAIQGAIPPLINLIRDTDIDKHVIIRNASGALLNLSHIEANRYDLHKAGVGKEFLRLLTSVDADVQFYSCAALSNLAVHSNIRQALSLEQDGRIFYLLIQLLSSPITKVKSQSAYVIRNLSSTSENQRIFVERGVLEPIYQMIISRDRTIMVAALSALRNLSIYPPNEDRIMKFGFPQQLCIIIRESEAADLVCHSIGILRCLCTLDQHETLINEYDIHTILAEKMTKKEGQNEQIQTEITSCLAVIASYPKVRPLLIALFQNQFLNAVVIWADEGHIDLKYNSLGIVGYLCAMDETKTYLIQNTRILDTIKPFLQMAELSHIHIGLWAIKQLITDASNDILQAVIDSGLELLIKRHTVNHVEKEISDLANTLMGMLAMGKQLTHS